MALYLTGDTHGDFRKFLLDAFPDQYRMAKEDIVLCGKQCFTMGGASSHDISGGILEPNDPMFQIEFQRLVESGAAFRINHQSWWCEELPSQHEYEDAKKNLDRVGWNVDYIITHCAPTSIQEKIMRNLAVSNPLTDFLEDVKKVCNFKYWFFGHYHDDFIIDKQFVPSITKYFV